MGKSQGNSIKGGLVFERGFIDYEINSCSGRFDGQIDQKDTQKQLLLPQTRRVSRFCLTLALALVFVGSKAPISSYNDGLLALCLFAWLSVLYGEKYGC